MRRYLHLRLDAPMMAFGAAQAPRARQPDDPVTQMAGIPPGSAVLPSRSMLTGLIANALGYDRAERSRLQALHDRVRFAAALVRPGTREQDFQSAQLGASDAGWTTRGTPEGRRGGVSTYESSHIRRMWYWANAEIAIALRVIGDDAPDTAAIAAALTRPERPLFLGRKAMLPASDIYRGGLIGDDAHSALELGVFEATPVLWDIGEGPADAPRVVRDDRSWMSGVHAGVYSQHVHPDIFGPNPPFHEDDL